MRPWASVVFVIGLTVAAVGQTAPTSASTPTGSLLRTSSAGDTREPAHTIAPGIRLVGPNHALEFLGVKFVGMNAENGRKVLITAVFVTLVLWLGRLGKAGVRWAFHNRFDARPVFWARQVVGLTTAVALILGLTSIWFDDPARLATVLGLVTAGLAVALQKVVTAVAGYFVILRGRTFNVGDRITMGGVRGDVVALGFIQTTIMEMGQPPAVEASAGPAMWVRSRQYTGRIVTVTNDKIFDEPVYNYTRDFPFIWEEMSLPVSYKADRAWVEHVLLEVARRHAVPPSELNGQALDELKRRYMMQAVEEIEPQVFARLTDNFLELTVRFVTRDHGVRAVKDAMTRDILAALDQGGLGLGIGSATGAGTFPAPTTVQTPGPAAPRLVEVLPTRPNANAAPAASDPQPQQDGKS